jgi:stage III sporulation protein AA
MKLKIVDLRQKRTLADEVPHAVISALPYRLLSEISRVWDGCRIEEIRLLKGRRASLTLMGRNLVLDTVLTGNEIESALSGICGGSLYAYSDTIAQGYISLDGGVRVGVSGRAACEGGRIIGVSEISSLAIRIPHRASEVGKPICDLLQSFGGRQGVLVYSAPGVGKTTLLRGVVKNLASGCEPLRVAIIDTRGELSFSLDGEGLCIDVLSGYPKGLGIEIATRTLAAEVIVCDEIGDYEEAMALVSSHNCGVPLVASAHAESVGELLRRPGIRLLHEAEIFGAYVGISRQGDMDFSYRICYRNDAEKSGEKPCL